MDLLRSFDPRPDHNGRLRELRTLAARMDAALRTSEALLRTAREIDLRGLDAEIGRLCAGALDLPPDQGRLMRQNLSELLARLDTIEAMLRRLGP